MAFLSCFPLRLAIYGAKYLGSYISETPIYDPKYLGVYFFETPIYDPEYLGVYIFVTDILEQIFLLMHFHEDLCMPPRRLHTRCSVDSFCRSMCVRPQAFPCEDDDVAAPGGMPSSS